MKGAATETSPTQDLMGSLLDQYLEPHRCRRGEVVEGVIASVSSKSILIDIGGKCDAVVAPREIEHMTSQDLRDLKPGQTVNVYVIDVGNDSGTMTVSLTRAIQQSDWNTAHKLMKSGETISLPVVDANKGGVIVRLKRLRGFVPGSQLLPNWRPHQNTEQPEKRWDALLGKTLVLRIIEVTPERNRLILSERNAVDNKARKRDILQKLSVGSIEEGTVSNVVPFGAFVNVHGVDGLLHISELSWKRVVNPENIVHVGQKIKVYVLDVDLNHERLGLSLKRLTDDPWENIREHCKEGQLTAVKIVNLTTFGAFAALVQKTEIEGLIHISELCEHQISRPHEVVSVGDQVTARIISLRPEERRIAFSLKQVQKEEAPNSVNPSQQLNEMPQPDLLQNTA